MALVCGAACQDNSPDLPPPATVDACANVEAEFQGSFDALAKLVAVETHRADNYANEDALVASMQSIEDDLKAQAQKFNEGQKTHKLEAWEWKKESGATNAPKYWWVFGFRLGKGPARSP